EAQEPQQPPAPLEVRQRLPPGRDGGDDGVDEHHQRRGGSRHPRRVMSQGGIDEGDDRDGDEAAAEAEEHGRKPDEAADEHDSEKFHSSTPAHRHQAGNRPPAASPRDYATRTDSPPPP